MWLAHGPEPARKWAELVGMSRPTQLFADPAKQAALEKALKECSSSKASTGSAADSKRKQPSGGAANQPWLKGHKRPRCHFCREEGHYARECPKGGATQMGPQPPV